MLRNVVAIGVRLNRPPSEVMAWSVDDYALIVAHFQLEAQDQERLAAKGKAKEALGSMPKPRRKR